MSGIGARARGLVSRDRLHRTFLDLLGIYSPSGKEEDVQLYLEAHLAASGVPVRRQAVAEERYNLVATLGDRPPRLFLVGHVDTVPAWGPEMTVPRQKGDVVTGLGSADMKGGCAAMVEAFVALAALPLHEQPAVGLLLAVDEEENGAGSVAFLREERPEWVVIGEPTSLTACFAHFGYLEAHLTTRGRRIHASLPELGHNAVDSMLRVLLHLGGTPLFKRESSGVVHSIRELTSSRAGFVVPDRCEAWIDLHLAPELDPANVERDFREAAAAAEALIPALDLRLNFGFASEGFDLGRDSAMARGLAALGPEMGIDLPLDTFRSHSDGNLFHQAGVKPLVLGPGNLEVAHTPDEHVDFRQIVHAAEIYTALCLRSDGRMTD